MMAEKEYIEREQARREFAVYFMDSERLVDECDDLLRYLPTADVVEVRHGHWNTTDTILGRCCECSVCGSLPTMEYRYCPYCGAKMDGKGE